MAQRDVRARGFAQESGQILVMTAVAMVALLAIAALSLDVSYMYDKRNRLHAAADAAAKSAAIELFRGNNAQANLEAFADQQVAALGFNPTRLGGTTVVTVNHPPVTPGFGDGYVEVVVSEDTSTFFATIVGRSSMTPGASAIAGSGNPSNCLITNQNLTIGGGNTQITLNGCGAGVGGSLSVGNGASTGISGTPSPPVAVTGSCSGQCGPGHAGTLTTGAPPPTDPLAGLTPYANPGGCPQIGNTSTINPGCYSQITTNVQTLTAGTYYVTGDITIGNNSTLTGNGVTIYMTGAGRINVTGNNANLTLTAPTSGTYKGIAIFQDVSDTNNWVAGNSFTLNVTGVIYMPGTDVVFNNNPNFASTQCNLFIAKSLTLGNGTGTFTNTGCAGLYGGAAFLTVTIVQ